MVLVSFSFLLFAIVAIVFAHLSSGRVLRPWVMLTLSLIFVAAVLMSWKQALLLAGYCAVVGLGVIAVDGRGPALPIILFFEIGLFVWLKQYTLISKLAPLPDAVGLAGLSYILFRGIHVTVDVANGSLKRPGILSLANYLLFFPTFLSGPIQRFEELSPQILQRGTPPTETQVFVAFVRGIFGCLKVTALSAFLFGFHQAYLLNAIKGRGAFAAGGFLAAASLYVLYLYVNFSGYMDIVVSLARLMGVSIPENFNHPLASTSFLELWTRWHVTLSDWFRFYVFNPIMKALAWRWSSPATAPILGVIAFFFTFLIMGLWHGSTVIFLFYGLVLGIGMSVTRLYQVVMTKWLGRKRFHELSSGILYLAIARGAVFTYFALAVTCLFLTAPDYAAMLRRTHLWLVPGALGLILVAAAVLQVWVVVEDAASTIYSRILGTSSWVYSAAFAVMLVILIAIQMWGKTSAPVFIYQGF